MVSKKKATESKFRSKYEAKVAANLVTQDFKYEYETSTFDYHDPITKGLCPCCGNKRVVQVRQYTPDFVLKDEHGAVVFYLETKGLFTSENRTTLLAMKKDHPSVDVRLLFMRDNKLHRSSPTRYSDWCNKHGFKWAVGEDLPDNWKEELHNGQ